MRSRMHAGCQRSVTQKRREEPGREGWLPLSGDGSCGVHPLSSRKWLQGEWLQGENVRREFLEHACVQCAVAGAYSAGSIERQTAAETIGDRATRLAQQNSPCCVIPGTEPILEEGFELTRRYVRQIQRGRSNAAHAVDLGAVKVCQGVQGRFHHVSSVVIETDRDHGLIQTLSATDPHPLAVMPCTFMFRGDIPIT